MERFLVSIDFGIWNRSDL